MTATLIKATIVLIIINISKGKILHQQDALNPNPGIYFEKMNTIKIKRAEWKVTIYINVDEFLDMHTPVTSYKEIYKMCTLTIEERKCKHALGIDLIELKQQNLLAIKTEIKETISSLGQIIYPTSRNPNSIRIKRLVPFGFIGTASKSLFGLVTNDDINNINKNIDQLFEDQTKIVHLMDENSHIISTKFDELYNITKNHQIVLEGFEKALTKTIKTVVQGNDEKKHLVEIMIYTSV